MNMPSRFSARMKTNSVRMKGKKARPCSPMIEVARSSMKAKAPSPTTCRRPGTSLGLAVTAVKNRVISTAATIMANVELVIDRSTKPRPGTLTAGRSTTLLIWNWCIGSAMPPGLLSQKAKPPYDGLVRNSARPRPRRREDPGEAPFPSTRPHSSFGPNEAPARSTCRNRSGFRR
ncbi:hypothetical protein D3C81_1773960 [compost metagenome]